jgi:uncharacterized protein DUF4019
MIALSALSVPPGKSKGWRMSGANTYASLPCESLKTNRLQGRTARQLKEIKRCCERTACFLMLGFVLSGTTVVAEEKEEDRNKVAIAAAEKWLRIVDEEKYAESWQETAELFKRSVTADQWRQALDGTRKPLGEQIAGKVKKSTYVTSVPGGPDGQYVIIGLRHPLKTRKQRSRL